MMNKWMLIASLLCFCIVNIATASTDDFITQQRQILEQQQQQARAAQQATQQQIQQANENLKKARNYSNARPSSTKTSNHIQPKTSAPICDCNANDQYNYRDNFLYDSNHQKTYRIHPYCKCKPQTISVTSSVSTIDSSETIPKVISSPLLTSGEKDNGLQGKKKTDDQDNAPISGTKKNGTTYFNIQY